MRREVHAQVIRFAAAIAVALTAAMAMAQTPEPQSAAPQTVTADRIDLASVAMGGWVESATSQIAWEEWSPVNLITANAPPQWGWSADRARLPQELVFSFFTHQAGVIDTVVINPLPKPTEGGAAKEVEIWTSLESVTDGFTQVASATLEPVDAEQAITFAPVEAKFVKLRILSAQPQFINNEPNAWPARLRRVRILEGSQPGYEPLLSRNEDLAALVAGVIPAPPADAAAPPIPADGPACVLPTEAPRKPNFAESRRVLVVSADTKYYTPSEWKPNRGKNLNNKNDYSLVERVEFTGVAPRSATPALLLPQMGFDTVVFSMVCEFDEIVSQEFQQALLPWVAAGHKLILQDADVCGAATGRRRFPTYSFLPYPFATVNPGARGAKGVAHLLESSSLISNDRESPSFVNLEAWVQETDGNGQEIGDSNLIVEWDPHWCGAVFARNDTQKNGFLLAYAKYGRGLIIYDGADYDQVNSPDYEKYLINILAQPFDPDNLPCSQPLGDFVLTTDTGLKTQHMTAGSSYTYPLTVYANNAYTGSVTIHASVSPADPTVSVTVEPATVELGELATASVTVTTTAATPATSHIVALRGVDTAGKSNTLCLNLPERRSGSVQVLSGLRQDRKPPRNIEIILDASGSMKAMLGGKSRWAVAQDVLKEVVAKLPADFSVGLRAYGHTLSSKDPNTCTDTALVLPVVPLNADQLLALAKGLAPRGETPLVYSILQTPADLQAVGGGTVILITDGEESCKGDFAAAEETLKASGLNLLLNIVGFTLDNAPAEAQLTQLAESTGGNYYGAASGEELARALLLAAVDRLPYRILDAAGEEVAQGEAGVGRAHELPAGDYTVVITAADLELRTPVTVETAKDSVLTAAIKGSQLVVEEGASAPEHTSGAPAVEAGAAAEPAGSPPPETKLGAEPVDMPQPPSTVAANSADAPPAETPVMVDAKITPPAQATAAVEPADNVTSTATAVPQDDNRQIYAAEVQALRDRLARLQSYLDEFPSALTDVSALAREYSTPEAAFNFVRDQIAFEPYPGLMKGARGTLVTRGGNALDRALLLAAVLRHNGISVHIAHAPLADGQRRQLLEWITSAPGATGRMLATLDGMARPAPATPEQQQLIDSIAQRAGIAAKMVSDAVADNWPLLDAALQSKGLGTAAGAEQQALEALADHYWVQAVVDSTTVDLDPSRAEAQPGQRLADAAASLDPDNLPDEVFQYINFRVIADFLEGNDIRSAAVLSQEYKAGDLFGKNIRLAIAPLTTAADESSIRAILRVGDKQVDGQSFQLTDKPATASPPAKEPDTGGGGMFDALSGGIEGGDDSTAESPGDDGMVTRLGRLSLEVISRGPHLAEASYRRVIMDRLDESQAGASRIDTRADDNSVRAFMIQAWDGAVSLGASHPVFVLQIALDTMTAQQSMAEKALANIYLGEAFGVEDLSPPTLSEELIAYYLSSDVTRHLLSYQGGRTNWYYERPRLAFFRHGFVVSDWAQPHGTSRFAEGIDLLNSPFRFLGAATDAVRLAAESGVADTALEQSLMRDEVFNTLPLFTAADSQGVPTLTIGPADGALLQNVDVPPAIRRVLAEDLAKGQMLLLPSRLVTLNNVQTFGWWSVDPVSGFALGKMELGGAQGFVEVTKMNERIQEWNEIFTKFYGGMLECYLGELQKNLGTTEDGLRTLQLNKGSGPGDNPVPGSDTLAACVIKTMCEVIRDLMISAVAKPAFAREAKATIADLEAAILRWALAEAGKQGTKAANKSVFECKRG